MSNINSCNPGTGTSIISKSRIMVASIIGAVMLSTILYMPNVFCWVTLCLLLISALEWHNMLSRKSASNNSNTRSNLNILDTQSGGAEQIGFVSNTNEIQQNESMLNSSKPINQINQYAYWCIFVGWVCPGFLSLILVREIYGAKFLLMYFCNIWLVDTLAMIVGKTIKGPKITPSVSPNKTYAGFVIGILLAAAISTALDSTFHILYSSHLFYYYCMMGILAQMGDLSLSYFKRQFGIKDFYFWRNIPFLGSHGGVLDRFDSIVISAPIYLALLAFNII